MNIQSTQKTTNSSMISRYYQPQFGFRTEDTFNKGLMERVVLPLTLSDIQKDKLTPSPELVERIVNTILEKGFKPNESPRGVVLTGVGNVIEQHSQAKDIIANDSLEMAVFTFQKNLIEAVKSSIDEQKGPDYLNPLGEKFNKHSFFFDGFFPNWGFWDAFKKTYDKFQAPFASTKYPHFDMGQPLTCTAYGPVKGLKNVAIKLFDARELTQDKNVDLKTILTQKDGRRVPTLKEPYLQQLQKNYCLTFNKDNGVTFDDWNILLFDNRVEGGVMHGATMPEADGPIDSIQRPMHQIVYDLSSKGVKEWLRRLGLKESAKDIPKGDA